MNWKIRLRETETERLISEHKGLDTPQVKQKLRKILEAFKDADSVFFEVEVTPDERGE